MIPILYEEPHFLLINKPAGLFSQAAGEIDSVQQRLIAQLKHRDQHPGEPFVGLPHRLDRGTSGVMLIARNQRALKRFGEQFHSRKIDKRYLALVEGEYPCDTELWEDHLRKIDDHPQAEIVAAGTAGAKPARASIQCLYRGEGTSLLQVQLETGRMHQIRVQAAARGFPVVGDRMYGSRLEFAREAQAAADDHPHPPLALHAWALGFHHPQSARRMLVAVAPPASWHTWAAGRWADGLPLPTG